MNEWYHVAVATYQSKPVRAAAAATAVIISAIRGDPFHLYASTPCLRAASLKIHDFNIQSWLLPTFVLHIQVCTRS